MLRICPGYRLPAVCGPVARARRVASPPGETCRTWQTFPEAMLRICPGYRLPAVCGLVARARRVAPPPGETCRTWQTFPEAMLRICPGYRLPAVYGLAARARRVASPPGVIWRIYPARESAGSRNRIRYRTRRRFLRAGDRQLLRSPTGWRRKLNRNGCR